MWFLYACLGDKYALTKPGRDAQSLKVGPSGQIQDMWIMREQTPLILATMKARADADPSTWTWTVSASGYGPITYVFHDFPPTQAPEFIPRVKD